MAKFKYWVITAILLGSWSFSFCSDNRHSQYRSVGDEPRVQSNVKEQAMVFIFIVVVGEIGKKLDNHYSCPVYCAVDHNHTKGYKSEKNESINKERDEGNVRTPSIAVR